jgi:GDPmannose 4,6-dehydratase
MSDIRREKVALITGVTGQDGSYLSRFLLEKGYEVHGIIRRASTFNTSRLDSIYEDPHSPSARLHLHYGDLTDGAVLRRILNEVHPSEIYNLGAQSHVRVSFDQPEYTADVVATGALRIFEAVREYMDHAGRAIRVYQAGSSEMFGSTPPPQYEATPFHPRSPYGVSKAAAHWYGVNYREAYQLFIANGILFNHESPERGETFVTRKVSRAVGRISQGLQDKLYMGNREALRDWGFAGDYVEAMWLMLQQAEPDDYVIATGESHSVQEFVEMAFEAVNLDWRKHVEDDPRYLRPSEVDHLRGDPSKARELLGWKPRMTFENLVQHMVERDLELARQEKLLAENGFPSYSTSQP